MKAVLPLALIGALAVGTAYAAGGDTSMEGGGASAHHQHYSHNDIKQIQSKLKEQGYDVGSVDGKMGHSTQQALRQFQEDKGIQASGQPDQQTLAALNVSPGGTQQGQLPQGKHGGHQSGGEQGGGMNSPQGGGMSSPESGGEQGGDQSR